MERLQSIQEFGQFQERLRAERKASMTTLVIPAGTCGQASGANGLVRIAKRELLGRKLTDRIQLRITGCHGFCEMEPSVLIEPQGTFYPKVDLSGMVRIIDAVARGQVVQDLLFVDSVSGTAIERQAEIPFFKKQVRALLSRNERVDPIRIHRLY